MLKRILSDIDVKEFIGLMLLFGWLSVYVIYFPGTVELDDTKQVRITLTDKPKYGQDLETENDYFILNAKGISRKFIVENWVLNQRTIEAINKIERGKDLIINIKKSEMNGKFIKRAKSNIETLALKQNNGDWIYSISDYNRGKVDRWKEYLFIGLFFGVLLLPWLIGKIQTLIKNEPKIINER